METIKKLAKSIDSDSKNGYTAAVLIAIIFVSSVVAGYYLFLRPPQKGYMTIYLLDSEGKAVDYPEVLVINQNNTFNVWVEVENHMGKSQYSEILVKTTNDTIPLFPVDADTSSKYEKTLEDGEKWETTPTITINEPGDYSVIFELWIQDEESGVLQYSENACVLNVKVTN